MSEERPLGLAELAEVDAPEVVGAALSRFRRRMLIRAVLIPAVVTAIIVIPRALPGAEPSRQRQYAEARNSHQIGMRLLSGPVDVVVLEAKRVEDRDGDWIGVRFVVTTDSLEGRERLAVGEGIRGILESCSPSGPVGPEPQPPVTVFSASFGSPSPDVADVVLQCPVGSRSARIEIGAYFSVHEHFDPSSGSPPPVSEPRDPGSITQDECAVPLLDFGVCALPKSEGTYRVLADVTIDLLELGVPAEIWRNG